MRIIYDPSVDALTIRLIEEQMECETIRLNDQVAVDIGPGERIVAIEILDASERLTREELVNVSYENLLLAATEAP